MNEYLEDLLTRARAFGKLREAQAEEAQRLVVNLAARAAEYALELAYEDESFCGCTTCVVRTVLEAYHESLGG